MPDSLNDWTSQAIPPGSGRYYALLHTDPALQQQQKLIVALVAIFSKLGFQSREIEVAKHKLHWWYSELEKQSFQHPVMTALDAPSDLLLTRLRKLLSAYGSLLEKGSPSGDNENREFHTNTGALACQLLCNTSTNVKAVDNVGCALSKVRCYRYLRLHVDQGLLCFPLATLEAASVSPSMLGPDNTDTTVKNFFYMQGTDLLDLLQSACEELRAHIAREPADKKGQYKSLYIYAQLQLALMHSMQRKDISVLNQLTRLTPIKNYWLALRAARRFDKS